MIAPILAGLGALALMSNPPRRRRRAGRSRRNPASPSFWWYLDVRYDREGEPTKSWRQTNHAVIAQRQPEKATKAKRWRRGREVDPQEVSRDIELAGAGLRRNPAPRFTEAAAKRLCRLQGIRGNNGGWVEVTPGHSVQGWYSVARWLRMAYERMQFEEAALLLEIAEGRRIGMPTLSKRLRLDRAAGILSGKPVSWRT